MYTEQYYGKVCHFIEVKLQTITQSTRIHATDMQCLQSVAGSAKWLTHGLLTYDLQLHSLYRMAVNNEI